MGNYSPCRSGRGVTCSVQLMEGHILTHPLSGSYRWKGIFISKLNSDSILAGLFTVYIIVIM